jgi:predicted dehydrogenase
MGAAFRIPHVATSRKETAERAKIICGAEIATTDYREITENPDIDIVHICTPNDLHVEQLLSAIRHRKKFTAISP